MLSNLPQELLLAILTAAILKGANAVWKFMNTPLDNTPVLTTAKMKRLRNQFLVSLFLEIACIIAFIKDYHPYLNFIFAVSAGFFIIILWGAFDAVYFPLEKIIKNQSEKSSQKPD